MKKDANGRLTAEEKFELITRNLQEVIEPNELRKLLSSGKEVSAYWGTMPTGSPHISYFYPLLKIGDFLKAGLRVKILIADLHAALEGVAWDVLERRQKYYESLIPQMLESVGVNIKKLEFVKGSDIQLTPKYFQDFLKLSTMTSVKDATRAASEVVKLGDNPKLGGILYPLMQALDEEYLKADIQFGGTDQRKIFVYARENLPKLNYRARVELMNFILPGLTGQKMSSSIAGTKIDLLEDEESVNKKINNAACVEGDANNGLMTFLKYVVFVIKKDRNESFSIKRVAKYGGNVEYNDYESLERDFVSKKIHPLDLKKAIAEEINLMIAPFRENSKLQKLYALAYEKN